MFTALDEKHALSRFLSENKEAGEKIRQNLTDKFCKEIDDLADLKEKEIMEI